MFEWVANPEAWVALATLAALEIVLGIDNIIFISILVGRLPEKQREPARFIGLTLAMVTRLALLFSIVWIMGLVEPWFTVFGMEVSGRDIILVGGGLFLLAKATHEIHNSLEGTSGDGTSAAAAGFGMVLVQIAILDIVFSLDSVITAVGLVDEISIMAVAIVLAVIVMLVAAKPIGDFVDRHPTVKMLALSFLIMVGLTLIVEGFDVHVPKGYIYFAMAFSVAVEMLNLRLRSKRQKKTAPVELHKPYEEKSGG
ncbi:TerC family protein [Microbulbifer halophilus]|uniref:TerC family protein n=1 Tax=Microbulbifer halophilus TaxID=453963 RepID=A0ABW5EDV5_9GAMM|nr:TerC family protein [Microbulbifer halophilus]MCW8127394.1 TerC family protein [Microbulbifer halophilus]